MGGKEKGAGGRTPEGPRPRGSSSSKKEKKKKTDPNPSPRLPPASDVRPRSSSGSAPVPSRARRLGPTSPTPSPSAPSPPRVRVRVSGEFRLFQYRLRESHTWTGEDETRQSFSNQQVESRKDSPLTIQKVSHSTETGAQRAGRAGSSTDLSTSYLPLRLTGCLDLYRRGFPVPSP